MMPTTSRTICAPVVLIRGILLGACGPATGHDTETAGETAGNGRTASAAEHVTITATEFSFDPAKVTVPEGTPVTVILENAGELAHNLVVERLDVSTRTIQPDERDRVTFTPASAGSYLLYCDVPGHREAGMTATLTVR